MVGSQGWYITPAIACRKCLGRRARQTHGVRLLGNANRDGKRDLSDLLQR
jgi:hypothetical protein